MQKELISDPDRMKSSNKRDQSPLTHFTSQQDELDSAAEYLRLYSQWEFLTSALFPVMDKAES